MRKILLIVLTFLCAEAYSQNFTSVSLPTVEGKNFSFSEIKKKKASVIVFLLVDCPACENYALTLNKMNEKYKVDNIAFYGVFPGKYSTANEMMNYKNRYKINFPLLVDKDKKLVKAIKAKVAPQAFLVNDSGQVLYNGRIDNWMYAVGKKRTVITHHELQDAIDATIKGTKIPVTSSTAVGCLIE
jgi:peroxiredoxin